MTDLNFIFSLRPIRRHLYPVRVSYTCLIALYWFIPARWRCPASIHTPHPNIQHYYNRQLIVYIQPDIITRETRGWRKLRRQRTTTRWVEYIIYIHLLNVHTKNPTRALKRTIKNSVVAYRLWIIIYYYYFYDAMTYGYRMGDITE